MNITQSKLNTKYVITSVCIPIEKTKKRIEELGFFTGSIIQLIKTSPLKKTFLITCLDTIFSIKKEIADCINVNVLE